MRKLKLLPLLFVLLMSIACGSSGPGDTAKAFVESLSKGEINDAKSHCTPQVAGMIDMWIAVDAIKFSPDAKFSVSKETVNGDLAEVQVTQGDSAKPDTIKLMKVDGKWLVNAAK